MTTITIDIETVPDLREGARERYIEAARQNIKVPSGATKESLAADLGITEKDEIKFTPRATLDAMWIREVGPTQAEPIGDAEWRKTSFDGSKGRCLMIGMSVDDGPITVFHDTDEAETLRAFFDAVSAAYRPQGDIRPTFVGHNVLAFDLRFILHRSIICGIRPPLAIPFNARPWDDVVFDTMTRWSGQGGRISLNDLASALGIKGKDGMDGSMVYDAYAAGEIDRLVEYCANDVEVTRNVYRRMTFQ